MFDFAEQTAVVTGASGNLGRAVAEAFSAAGANLVLVDLKQESLESMRATLPFRADPLLLPTDLTDADAVARMAERAMSHFGRIDVLANIAGGFTMGPRVHETEDRDWTFMLDLNARTVFNTCRAVVPHMLLADRGRIVNVSARAVNEVKGRMAAYRASKSAVLSLTESLAAEHKHDGINVNCILPGTIDTPQNRESMPDADFSTWVPPAALADVVLFLASPAARAVNGAAVPVYGRS
jgi:NAD(P)-dependent dehydrogenase (short-subunit alcohol dehydrogenase family)